MSTSQTMPLPAAPSTSIQRVMKRRALKSLDGEALFTVGLPADRKDVANFRSPLVAIGIEESIARVILSHFPAAHRIEVIEDVSHDAPHGHVGKVFDEFHTVLVDGLSDEWYDLEWAKAVDEKAWDFYYYASSIFSGSNDAGQKSYLIPSRVI